MEITLQKPPILTKATIQVVDMEVLTVKKLIQIQMQVI